MAHFIRYLKHWKLLHKAAIEAENMNAEVPCASAWPVFQAWVLLTCVMVHVESVVLQQRCIFSWGHILSFSLLSTLFSTLHPLQLGELQLCTSQDQRLVLLAKSICVAIESLPNLLFSSPGPHTPNTHPYTHAFMSAPWNPHPSLADSSANPKSEDMKNEIQIQYVHLNQLCGWPCRNTWKIQFRLLWGLFFLTQNKTVGFIRHDLFPYGWCSTNLLLKKVL